MYTSINFTLNDMYTSVNFTLNVHMCEIFCTVITTYEKITGDDNFDVSVCSTVDDIITHPD